jgi:hypothetical protein
MLEKRANSCVNIQSPLSQIKPDHYTRPLAIMTRQLEKWARSETTEHQPDALFRTLFAISLKKAHMNESTQYLLTEIKTRVWAGFDDEDDINEMIDDQLSEEDGISTKRWCVRRWHRSSQKN